MSRGLGDVYKRPHNVIALDVLAIPPILTHTYVGIDRADRDAVEAARGMGTVS
jgi:osmoprotectant transport system permease protein